MSNLTPWPFVSRVVQRRIRAAREGYIPAKLCRRYAHVRLDEAAGARDCPALHRDLLRSARAHRLEAPPLP